MRIITLHKTGDSSLEKRYLKNKKISHVTGNQIKLLPFKTNPSGDVFGDDFKSFQGIIGELYRLLNSKTQIEFVNSDTSFTKEFKSTILKNALSKVSTKNSEELEKLLSTLFFNEDKGLIKFNSKTLLYMNFINNHNAIKEVPKFIIDLFELDSFSGNLNLKSKTEENILHQLLLESLPELPGNTAKVKNSSYYNVIPELKVTFREDFNFLIDNPDYLLKYSEEFFKYYYFQYLSQLIISFNNFGSQKSGITPVYFTLEWETLSESRLSNHALGWKHLNNYSSSIFSHVNTVEFLNYIYVNDNLIGSYNEIVTMYQDLNPIEKEKFNDCLNDLISFYKENTILKTGSWEECENHFSLDSQYKLFNNDISKEIYRLQYVIHYQFENSDRKGADVKYGKWFSRFTILNYTKNRGRLGNTMVLTQELLLFLTRLCIGTEDKIRLKVLWDKFKERGITFDETSKSEITKLFEKINLIEKKSDSGDAQYVKSTI